MLRIAHRLGFVMTALAVALTAAPPGVQASSPSAATLSLQTSSQTWTGSAPWPNLLGCQRNDPTCDHHVITVGDDVDPLLWSVAVDVNAIDTHVAVYRITDDAPSADVMPLGQTIVATPGSDLTAIAASPHGGRVVFLAVPGTYDIEVAGTGTPVVPETYSARASLCAGTACSGS